MLVFFASYGRRVLFWIVELLYLVKLTPLLFRSHWQVRGKSFPSFQEPKRKEGKRRYEFLTSVGVLNGSLTIAKLWPHLARDLDFALASPTRMRANDELFKFTCF